MKSLKLKKLVNTRDLGGLPAAEGKTVKYGKLIRSGKLYALPQKTKKKLSILGVNLVVDLRMDEERLEYPCDLPEGCAYLRLPLFCTMKAGVVRGKKMRKLVREEGKRIKREYPSADAYMEDLYREILSLPEFREVLERFLKTAVSHEGCMLWCCTVGKDRTGICAMLLESLLGVDEEWIMTDYTLSYRVQRRKRLPQKWALWLPVVPPSLRDILIAMINAKPEYLNAALDYMKQNYGSAINYCKEALHITDDDIATLRSKYLE